MTVHELPTPSDVAQADERRTRSGRIKMLALALICMAPVIASYITYYFIRPQGSTRNHADLIQREIYRRRRRWTCRASACRWPRSRASG